MIPVVADALTLFGATIRGLLIHLDYQGLIRLHWSPLILDEMSQALVDNNREPDAESALRHEQHRRAALPQAETPTQQVQAQFASVAPLMRSVPEPERLPERLATDVKALPEAALHEAWQQGAARL